MRPSILAGMAACSLVLLAGCSEPQPVRVGFLGELSGPSADLGEMTRNGAALALDEWHQGAGSGRPRVELIVRDSGVTPETARRAVEELIASQAIAIIGPGTSGVAEAVLPVVNQARMLLLSPSASASRFTGLDDYLVRMNRTTRENGADYARYCVARGLKRLAVAANLDNRVYSDNWLEDFRRVFEQLGGRLVVVEHFASTAENLESFADRLLSQRVDAVLMIASAADSARIAQLVAKRHVRVPLLTSEWAGTQQLLEAGGRAVEGMTLMLNHDTRSASPEFVQFTARYQKQYGKQPAFQAMLAYDGMRALLAAYQQKPADMSMKEALLRFGPYQGLQQEVRFDAWGDSMRRGYFHRVQGGAFEAE